MSAPEDPLDLSPVGKAAKEWAEQGCFVFPTWWTDCDEMCACPDGPTCDSPGKHPLTAHGFKDATRDVLQLRQWWNRWPNANVAIDCERSGIILLDFDKANGGDATFWRLFELLGLAPLGTRKHHTPNGGFHLLYRDEGRPIPSPRGIMPGLDLRSRGAYALVPPSCNGRAYSVDREQIEMLTFPDALRVRFTERTSSDTGEKARFEMPERIVHGTRHSKLLSLAGLVRDRGMTADEILVTLRAVNRRCVDGDGRPDPLSDDALAYLANDVATRYTPTRPFATNVLERMVNGHAPRKQDAAVGEDKDARPSFVRASELLAESDDDDLQYVVDNMLAFGGTSIIAGRPKAGKSTLWLNLGLAVARGEPFLGRETCKGAVLYLALEGARGYWKAMLRALGVTKDDDLYCCIGRAPEGALQWLRDEIRKHHAALVIVDPLQRLLRVKDSNDYATGSNVMDSVIELTRLEACALSFIHHSGKTRHAEIVDEVMGTTAWAAGPDTVIVLRRTGEMRTVASEGRYGENLPETVIAMDPETHAVTCGGTKAEVDLAAARELIVEFLTQYAKDHPDQLPPDEETINEQVEARTSLQRTALREAVTAGGITRSGAGKRNDPYRYKVS